MQDTETSTQETWTTVDSQQNVADNPSEVAGLTSIIILCHNLNYPLFHYTGNCIGSVREHTKLPYEIILVDNGSPIKPQRLSDYKADKVIQNEENKGIAAAWNQAIRVSSGEYVCLLNNDTMVFDSWLEGLQEALQDLDLVMATPMYGEPFSRAVEASDKAKLWEGRDFREAFSDFRDFSCVLARKSLFREIGTFDEQFFVYLEDLDFLKRMDEAGKKYASTKKVNTYHVIGGTSTGMVETPDLMNESREKFKEKWGA